MEATQQRRDENIEYKNMMAADTAAKDLLKFARNRLNQFYNPKLYVPPEKRELSAEGRIEASISGTEPPTEAPGGIADTGIAVLAQNQVAPPPPPQAVAAYRKKSEENTGV